MNCLNPMKIKNPYTGEIIPTPCRHCINCTTRKIQELKVYAQAEQTKYALKGSGSSFIRLSYDDVNLPVVYNGELKRLGELIVNNKVPKDFYPTLLKSDIQKFWKRFNITVKRKFSALNYSYIYCGEFGENYGRPHYHIILFGIDTDLAKQIIGLTWKFGFVDYRPLKAGAVTYCAKYMYNDVYGAEREKKYTSKGIEAPFLCHSKGFGDDYLKQQFMQNPDLQQFKSGGYAYSLPSYFRKKYNLQTDKHDNRTKSEQIIEAQKKAENYVIQQRQRGIAVDSRSLRFNNINNSRGTNEK